MWYEKKAFRVTVAIVVVAILIATSVAVVFLPKESSRQTVFTGETFGVNSYGNAVFDLNVDELYDAGYELGDTFDVEIKGKTIHDAVLSALFMGTFMFDTYLNVDKNGYLAAGSMWNNILSKDPGNKVTVTYSGHNDDYDKLDKFLVPLGDDRSAYDSDEAFANFYEVTGGDIKSKTLYRSFTPFGSKTRAAYADMLADDEPGHAAIQYGVALSYNVDKEPKVPVTIGGYCYGLYLSDKYVCYNITYHYFSEKAIVSEVLTKMSENDGPYLMHCNVGRDRTGFLCTLIQALYGADEATMKATAAQAYVNLYGVVPGSEEYDVIVKSTYCRNMYFISNYDQIDVLLSPADDPKLPIDWSDKSVDGIDTKKAAEDFCIKYLGLDQSVLDNLRAKLCA